jgi:uncharacterized surface protein with fasciclin (FAS1) repeats
VFVPSNQAFEDLPQDQKDNLQDLSYVKVILLYHIIHGRHQKHNFRNEAHFKSESRMTADSELLEVRLNVYHDREVCEMKWQK